MPQKRIILPLDLATLADARALASRVREHIGVLKVGLELFTSEGPAALDVGRELDKPVFLDLKLHDIPETVERTVAAAARHGVRYLTVHALGGESMLRRAVERAGHDARLDAPLDIVVVTVLTSLNDTDLNTIGLGLRAADEVLRLAELAWRCGIRGFVCSSHEVATLRRIFGPTALLIVPGVRPSGTPVGDQRRTSTPAEAIALGADLLVIGRPIRDADDPVARAREIAEEIDIAVRARPPGPSSASGRL